MSFVQLLLLTVYWKCLSGTTVVTDSLLEVSYLVQLLLLTVLRKCLSGTAVVADSLLEVSVGLMAVHFFSRRSSFSIT